MADSQSSRRTKPKWKTRWMPWRERFWRYIEKTDTCWLWHGPMDGVGYGLIHADGRRRGAHRISYELANGPIVGDLFVCHHCDVRRCVNPDHLFLGTQKDNIQDAKSKHRLRYGHMVGEKHGNSIVTNDQVLEIRRLYAMGRTDLGKQKGAGGRFVSRGSYRQIDIAKMFSVSRSLVNRVVGGRGWKHVR